MTLAVRDEADVIEANIGYHLDAGVDFVIATDPRSTDGTTESYAAMSATAFCTSSAGTTRHSGRRSG